MIIVGLNGQPSGQFLNKNLSEEQKQFALDAGKFNQKYWDLCTKITDKILQKCEDAMNSDRKILFENVNECYLPTL